MSYIVTDLTLMSNGNACIACIDEDSLQCFRPLFQPEFYRKISWYVGNGIQHGTKLNLMLSKMPTSRPHKEDTACALIQKSGILCDADMKNILDLTSVTSIEDGFGVCPNVGSKYFSYDSDLPDCSIITLKTSPDRIEIHQDGYNVGRVRIGLEDGKGFTLSWLPVTDLRCVNISDDDFESINENLESATSIFLRLGLTRRYASPRGENQDGYWVQVNGLYMFS